MGLKYGVIGTGALGGFYGGKLARAGEEVHFLLRSDYHHVLQNGLRVESVAGDFLLPSVSCYPSVANMPSCDVILVCLKTTNNKLLPDLLRPVTHENSLVILIQNGLGMEEELAAQMPELSIAGGMAFICSHKAGPGYIQHLDLGRLVIGLHTTTGQTFLEQCCSDFERAGVPAKLAANLGYARWQKLVWNVPFNGMTVVLNTTTDQLMNNKATRQLAYDMMLEVIEGARQCGYDLDVDFAQKMMITTEKMTPYAPSMKLDFDNRRLMEVQTIYSNPVKMAREAGFEMKKVQTLERQLRFIESTMISTN